jgi:hypothetical protein
MTSRLAKLLVVPALAAAGVLVAPLSAAATPVTHRTVGCGSTVAGPASLTHDLHCHGDGITLLRGSLDLRHHTISGDGTGTALIIGDESLAETPPVVRAAVKDGTIRGFATGVAASDGSDDRTLTLSGLTVTKTPDGVNGFAFGSISLDRVSLTDASDAAVIADHGAISLTRSRVSHNAVGFVVINDGHVDLDLTVVGDNAHALDCSQGRVTINRSLVTRNGQGLNLFECEGSSLTESAFLNNGAAATAETEGFDDIASPTLRIDRVLFQGNTIGLHLSTQAMSVSVHDSLFRHNGTGIVMDPDVCAPNEGGCTLPINDDFTGNTFSENTGDGVSWGFGTLTAANNRFVDNGGWGFVAAAGTTVVDGGGNVAHGNAAGNCQGLACS